MVTRGAARLLASLLVALLPSLTYARCRTTGLVTDAELVGFLRTSWYTQRQPPVPGPGPWCALKTFAFEGKTSLADHLTATERLSVYNYQVDQGGPGFAPSLDSMRRKAQKAELGPSGEMAKMRTVPSWLPWTFGVLGTPLWLVAMGGGDSSSPDCFTRDCYAWAVLTQGQPTEPREPGLCAADASWILTREPNPPSSVVAEATAAAEALGVSVSGLEAVQHEGCSYHWACIKRTGLEDCRSCQQCAAKPDLSRHFFRPPRMMATEQDREQDRDQSLTAMQVPIDMDRFMGVWYPQGPILSPLNSPDNRNQMEQYTKTSETSFDVSFVYETSSGPTAQGLSMEVANPPTNTRFNNLKLHTGPLRVPIGFLAGEMLLLDLASDYSTAIVSDTQREWVYIFTREKHPDPRIVQSLKPLITGYGFDMSKWVDIEHDNGWCCQMDELSLSPTHAAQMKITFVTGDDRLTLQGGVKAMRAGESVRKMVTVMLPKFAGPQMDRPFELSDVELHPEFSAFSERTEGSSRRAQSLPGGTLLISTFRQTAAENVAEAARAYLVSDRAVSDLSQLPGGAEVTGITVESVSVVLIGDEGSSSSDGSSPGLSVVVIACVSVAGLLLLVAAVVAVAALIYVYRQSKEIVEAEPEAQRIQVSLNPVTFDPNNRVA